MKELRDATSLKQQQLADYTKQPIQNISMFELGLRSLPTAALVDIVAIYHCLPKDTTPSNLPDMATELATESDMATKAVALYKQKCKIQCYKKEKKLAAMKKLYQQSLTLVQTIRTLRNKLPQTPENADKLSWLDLTERMTLSQLQTCSLGKQQVLQLQIDMLTF